MIRDTRTYAEQVSDDFWAWLSPRLDARAELEASMPARDEATRTVLGEEMLDIEFEPIAQVDLDRGPVLSER